MDRSSATTWIAFNRSKCIAVGTPEEVAAKAKTWVDRHAQPSLLIFDATTSQPVELDLRGTRAAVLDRVPIAPIAPTAAAARPSEGPPTDARRPGRPRLGVVAREVTLLPRHWAWLAGQSGGASVALRKLVEHASRSSQRADALRAACESAYRFMSAMAGDEPGFEEAARALFHGNIEAASQHMAPWPADVRKHAVRLLEATRAEPPSTVNAAPSPP